MVIGGIIVCLFTSSLLFFFSYMIWKKQQFTLIAGFKEETFKGDKNKLAKAVGIFLMICGVLTFILPFGVAVAGSIAAQMISILIVLGIIILVWYINRLGKLVT